MEVLCASALLVVAGVARVIGGLRGSTDWVESGEDDVPKRCEKEKERERDKLVGGLVAIFYLPIYWE